MEEQWKQFGTTNTGGPHASNATRERYWWISDHGRVKVTNNYNDHIKWPKISLTGGNPGSRYPALSGNYHLNKYVHKLVAIMFCNNPFGITTGREVTVDHINGDKTDNHYTNLEWVTMEENIHRYWMRKYNDQWSLSDQQIIAPDATRQDVDAHIIDLHIIEGMSRREIQEHLGMTQARVARPIRAYSETVSN